MKSKLGGFKVWFALESSFLNSVSPVFDTLTQNVVQMEVQGYFFIAQVL